MQGPRGSQKLPFSQAICLCTVGVPARPPPGAIVAHRASYSTCDLRRQPPGGGVNGKDANSTLCRKPMHVLVASKIDRWKSSHFYPVGDSAEPEGSMA